MFLLQVKVQYTIKLYTDIFMHTVSLITHVKHWSHKLKFVLHQFLLHHVLNQERINCVSFINIMRTDLTELHNFFSRTA